MTKILVTGGAGYVGSHCLKKLVDLKYDCIVYDNLSRGFKELVRGAPLVVGDIRDKEKLNSLFKLHKFDAVMHFAALAYVGESVREPIMYWDNNVFGTKTLLEVAVENNVKKIVFSSTCAVYGQPDFLPISEVAPTNPINPYGQTKLACETLMDNLDVAHQLKSIRFRYFNAAGADYKSNLGELHNPETHLLPLVIEAALKKGPPINIFGNDFDTPDGSAIRDYVHVNDLADAHIIGLDYLLRGGQSSVVNLGTGVGTSVLDILKLVEAILKRPVPFKNQMRRPGDPAKLIADPKFAAEILGWNAKLNISDIIFDALEWHKKISYGRLEGL